MALSPNLQYTSCLLGEWWKKGQCFCVCPALLCDLCNCCGNLASCADVLGVSARRLCLLSPGVEEGLVQPWHCPLSLQAERMRVCCVSANCVEADPVGGLHPAWLCSAHRLVVQSFARTTARLWFYLQKQ